jgi:hypothetical protein
MCWVRERERERERERDEKGERLKERKVQGSQRHLGFGGKGWSGAAA